MIEMAGPRTLWAMHPDFLVGLLSSSAFQSFLPEGLRGLVSAMSVPIQARAPADPIRDGGTLTIPLDGPVSPKGSYGGTSTDRFAEQVRAAAGDDKVGVTVVKISSPGGLFWGTSEAADAVFEHRQVKPIIAVAAPYSFSAAHWIGTQASAYYASPSADVGSTGVRGGHVDKSGFEDKIGMKTTLIASSPEKIAGHPFGPLTDEDRAYLQEGVDEANQAFVAAIARGRGITAAEVPTLHGEGRTFSAARAASLGTIDGVMSMRDVVAKFGSSRNRLALMRRRAEANRILHDI